MAEKVLTVGGARATKPIADFLMSNEYFGPKGGVYYVDGNVAATGNGSPDHPYATLAEAITASDASIGLAANRWWARRNRIYVCGDALSENLVKFPTKCDVIGCGSYDGFTQAYGFKFKNVKQMEIGLKYKAIANKEVNVINAFSTDGLLITYKLRVLVDDKKYFPPYHGAFLVRIGALEKYPQLETVLDKLAGQITDSEMQKLNFEVDQEKKDPAVVVKTFLKAKGLVR